MGVPVLSFTNTAVEVPKLPVGLVVKNMRYTLDGSDTKLGLKVKAPAATNGNVRLAPVLSAKRKSLMSLMLKLLTNPSKGIYITYLHM
jgi:hypothetical protein